MYILDVHYTVHIQHSVKSLMWITTNVTLKSPPQEANSCSATNSIPCLLQNMWVHYYFHHSLSHTPSHKFFRPTIFCSHTYSSLNNITILRPVGLVHFNWSALFPNPVYSLSSLSQNKSNSHSYTNTMQTDICLYCNN